MAELPAPQDYPDFQREIQLIPVAATEPKDYPDYQHWEEVISGGAEPTPPVVPTVYEVEARATGKEPFGVAVSPDGENVYVTNGIDNTISQFHRNTTTGGLSALATPTIATGNGPQAIAISPDGKHVYVCNQSAKTVSQYSRSAATGELAALAKPTIETGPTPSDIAISPDGKFVYVPEGSESEHKIVVLSRNESTGELILISVSPRLSESPARISLGEENSKYLYVATTNYLYTLSRNEVTGGLASAFRVTISEEFGVQDVLVSEDGASVYVTLESANTVILYPINEENGHPEPAGARSVGTGTLPQYMVISPGGTNLYVTVRTAKDLYSFGRDQSSGVLYKISTEVTSTTGRTARLAISPDGKSIYIAIENENKVLVIGRPA